MAEGILGRGRRQFPDPRHALQPRHDAEDAARQAACSRSAIRRSATRSRSTPARRNSTAASSRGSTASSFGIVVNKHAQRFYDEGEDIWPKRYAIWGRLVAAQPDQIAYIIFDAKSLDLFMPSLFPPIEAHSDRANSPASSTSIRRRWRRPIADFNAAVRPGTFDHTILDDCRTEGLTPPKIALGAAASRRRRSTPIRCGPASPSPISASRVNQQARMLMKDGTPSANMFAAGEIMAGNVLGQGLCRRHRHDDRQRVRPHRRTRRRRSMHGN